MIFYPKMQLSHLREIGWRLWDPIGLKNRDGTWNDACADEYDSYLFRAAGMMSQGHSRAEVSAYLVRIASDHMGLSYVNEATAVSVSDAIANYLLSLPDGPTVIG
ncbi:hypothetical protein [Sphingobium yanoikuyae]|uniref:hypothetical protein n=1 Tax=Sphingobium yanoikuyae TaxID=13690 RepID=UPI0028A80704|nr:hypothetical protein [Sphingobium yanoikuyae]